MKSKVNSAKDIVCHARIFCVEFYAKIQYGLRNKCMD